MYQIKFELKHKERFSTDIMYDAEATKQIMIYLIGGKTIQKENYELRFNDFDGDEAKVSPVSSIIPNLGVNGFIHELMSNPFGFLLLSEIQVNINIIVIFYDKIPLSNFNSNE